MKKFTFRLEPVLKLRRVEEDKKKRAVGVLLTEISRQQQAALDMANAITRQGVSLKSQFECGKVDVDWIAYYQGYVANMQQSISEKIAEVGRIQEKLAFARADLAEAAKQTKILEKLKEKQQNRFKEEIRKQETAELDEMANNNYHRKMRMQA